MACSSRNPSSDFELQLAARAGLHSLHNFVSLVSPAATAAASSSSSLQHLQHRQSMAAAETIGNFRHLGALLAPHRGHARVRHAPRIPCADTVHSCTHTFPSPVNPASYVGNPNLPISASDQGFRVSHMGQPSMSNCGSGSTSCEECTDSVGVDNEEQSLRGSSHIDLNSQIGNYDYVYEGSVNSKFARGAIYNTQDSKSKDSYSNLKADDDFYSNNPKLTISQGFPSMIVYENTNPTCFDLNQQAPSLDSTSEASNHVLTASSTKPPLCCPQPTKAISPLSQETFSFGVHKQSPAVVLPSLPASSTCSAGDDKLSKFTNNLSQRSTPVYEGNAHNHKESLTRQLAQEFSTTPHVESQLEKATCSIISTTPTHSSHLSCLSLEGNFFQLQPTNMASIEAILVKRKCLSSADESKSTKCGNTPSNCSCAKRRKLKKKAIVRVPAISDKIAEIPQDEHSWRKYGQKPIKGSPHPRGYYKCSGVKGCPAKKHVERALDDPTMLIVTYEGEHIHTKPMVVEPS